MSKEKIRGARWWDWSAVILLLLIVQIAAYRLVVTRWTADLSIVQVVGLFGTLLGLTLGQSIYSRKIAFLFILAYGLCVIPWQLGLTLESGIRWIERLRNLSGRINIVVQELVKQEEITDNILFLLIMALVFWFVAIYSGFTLVRYAHTWRVVLPVGLATFIIHSFDPLLRSRSWFLAFNLFFSLLLVARIVFLRHRALWKQQNTHLAPDVGFDLARVTFIMTLVLVFFAWNVPVSSETFRPVAKVWRSATNPINSLIDKFSYVFASLKPSVGVVKDFFGESLPLGLEAPLSEEIIMEVNAPRVHPEGLRYYWRARVYSQFNGNKWSVGLTGEESPILPSDFNLLQPGVDAREEASFTFYPAYSISTLYVAPQPLWISRPAESVMVPNPDGTIDLESIQTQEYLKPGEQYEVRSSLSAVTIKELRETGTEYPQWVLDRYLQLPEDITSRTTELAQALAEGQETPYDIAAAITDYLRSNITYQRAMDSPPSDVNWIDWFLFEYKQGFCYYYATSEVILLRSLGIPSRIAVGFTQGEQQVQIIGTQQVGQASSFQDLGETVTYIVRDKNAHAWPEVYFPEIGWVEFEPTANQDALYRPSGIDPTNVGELPPRPFETPTMDDLMEPENLSPDDTGQRLTDANQGFWTVGNLIRLGLLILTGIFITWVVSKPRRRTALSSWYGKFSQQSASRLEKGLSRLGITPPTFLRNWIYYSGLHPLSRAYLEIDRSLKRLGRQAATQETPAERAEALIQILPVAQLPTNQLLSEYQMGIYSLHSADIEAAEHASRKIRNLSYHEKFTRFLARLKHLFRKRYLV